MKYLEEYRDKNLSLALIKEIRKASKKPMRIMEVCGGHTMSIRKFGIHKLLPENIELLSGPGCPVCVTATNFIDKLIVLAQNSDTIITTYGDLIRVPGSRSSLEKERAKGADIRIIYSTLDALKIADQNRYKKIIFPGIGFETTTPSSAVAILEAKKKNLNNFYILSAHKLMPPAMSALIEGGTLINGYIGPGHVSTIAGSKIYEPLLKKFNISVVIAGFEPVDILQSILMLVRRFEEKSPGIEIQYSRAVTRDGNMKAQEIVGKTFETRDDSWRGLGNIPNSGLKLKSLFEQFDAEAFFNLRTEELPEPKGCICGEILKGIKKPSHCKLFGKLCTPENPVGACMVSAEGTCAAYYKYNS
jgi:hydrogenase expression/formation protein HypD